jgi:hypothetical protein
MYPILIALLLAACLFDPWSHVDDVPFPEDATHTEDQREHRDPSLYVSSHCAWRNSSPKNLAPHLSHAATAYHT